MLEKIIETLSLTEWKKKRIILSELKQHFDISERSFRKLVEINNRLFGNGQTDYYIAHSCRGYKLTFDYNEMKQSVADNRKRAITMLKDCNNIEETFKKRNYAKLDLEEL